MATPSMPKVSSLENLASAINQEVRSRSNSDPAEKKVSDTVEKILNTPPRSPSPPPLEGKNENTSPPVSPNISKKLPLTPPKQQANTTPQADPTNGKEEPKASQETPNAPETIDPKKGKEEPKASQETPNAPETIDPKKGKEEPKASQETPNAPEAIDPKKGKKEPKAFPEPPIAPDASDPLIREEKPETPNKEEGSSLKKQPEGQKVPRNPRVRSVEPLTSRPSPPHNYKQTVAIIGTIAFAILTAFAALCFTNQFPAALLGGKIGSCLTMIGCGAIFIGCGVAIWLSRRRVS